MFKRGSILMVGLAALVPVMFLAGCETGNAPDVTTHYDQFSGLRTDLMGENLLEAGDKPRELVWLNASRVYETYSKYTYYLEVTYMAREEVGLLGINPGQSLVLVVDGETIPLSGSGSLNTEEKPKKGLVEERAIYKVNKPVLQKIAIARKVKVTIKGRNGLIERQFNEENFDRFRKFVTNYAL
jgi:hypothetical protein